jgi:hypothetical protein
MVKAELDGKEVPLIFKIRYLNDKTLRPTFARSDSPHLKKMTEASNNEEWRFHIQKGHKIDFLDKGMWKEVTVESLEKGEYPVMKIKIGGEV